MWPPAAIDWTSSHSCTHSFFPQKWGDGQLCEGHCSDGVDTGQMLPVCVPRERTDISSCGGSEPSIPQRDGSGSPGVTWGFPGGVNGEESTHQCRRHKRGGYDPWVRRIPWRRAWQPTPVFLPGESHGQRSLVGCSPRGHKESDMAEHSRSHLECGLILLYVTVLKKVQ